jgi:hypothetical protein
MTTVQEIFKDIEDTFDIHDPVRKYFESKKALWLESEQNIIVSAYSNGWHDGQDVIIKQFKHVDKGGDAAGLSFYNNELL